MKKIHQIVAYLLSVILLFTAGCSKPTELPEKPTADAATAPAETTEPILNDTSLVSLRQAMVETPQLFAVAYFGCPDIIDPDTYVDPYAVMQEQAPELCAELPFLLDIPAERVIGSNGDLFCIVPLDEDATVAVSKGTWNDSSEELLYEKSLYFAKSGEPILLFCNNAGFEPDTQLCISGPSGEVIWYPMIDDNCCAMPLRNENWEDMFLDFSPYREMLVKRNRDMKDEWATPTAEMLYGSTWCWEGFLKDGREVSYQLSFHGDTLSVQWNDGMDAEPHVYRDALWELTEEEGFAILSIDFREMAGILRYNLLYHEDYELLYMGMDVVQAEMPIGWEPLYRYLTLPIVPEPVEMLGQWELAWTEVEGDRCEAEPGAGYIDIFLNDENGFRITLEDGMFPQNSFYNKELAVYEGEIYPGCGNDQWMAYIGYMGKEDIIYSLTLLPDDTLLLRMYWENDGAPMVAHHEYRRVIY